MFILAISWLTTSNLPWFMDLTGEGSGTPFQYSCLENPMDGGAWKAAVHAKGRTWLSDFTFTFRFHALEKEMATHCSVLGWRIPGTGELGGLLSMESHRVGHDWCDFTAAAGGRKKVQCCKEPYYIGTRNNRSMIQRKLEVVKQNIDILGISELKWTGMGEFNLDDHYFYYCGQESLKEME